MNDDKPITTSYSIPPSTQFAVNQLAAELGMSKSALVAHLLEGSVMELREIKRKNPDRLDLNTSPTASRSNGEFVEHMKQVITTAIRRHRRGH